MPSKRRPISDREQSVASVERLLYSRTQTAHALGGISIATVQRMERREACSTKSG